MQPHVIICTANTINTGSTTRNTASNFTHFLSSTIFTCMATATVDASVMLLLAVILTILVLLVLLLMRSLLQLLVL